MIFNIIDKTLWLIFKTLCIHTIKLRNISFLNCVLNFCEMVNFWVFWVASPKKVQRFWSLEFYGYWGRFVILADIPQPAITLFVMSESEKVTVTLEFAGGAELLVSDKSKKRQVEIAPGKSLGDLLVWIRYYYAASIVRYVR